MAEPHPIPNDFRFQDLTGKRFGKIEVLFYAGRKSAKYSLWHCRCDCGREQDIVSSCLTLGRTTSCLYCFRHKPKVKRRSDFKDLTGQVFGRLTVISLQRYTKTLKLRRGYWNCKCSCGESVVARGDQLQGGDVSSCGCMNVVKRWRDTPQPATKTCSSCKRDLPLDLTHFRRSHIGKYGFMPKCRDCVNATKRKYWERTGKHIRMKVLIHYGGTPPKCDCCGEQTLEFLAIDHIEGGGNKHRQKINAPFYPWLIRNKFPKGYRVLCHNCNCSLGRYGYCPHKR